MKRKTGRKLLSFLLALAMLVGLVPGMGLTAYAEASISGTMIDVYKGSGTVSSDMTCTKFIVFNSSTLTINQGVTVTLNNPGWNFNFFDESKIELHGTLAGSAGSGATWMDRSYINVYLSDGAKYTVTGLTYMDGDNYLRYYGYDAATDGNGTVSVTSGSTAVTASSIGYKTTTYTFTATPASGYKFKNWTKGAGGEVLGTDASINVTCEQNGTYQVYANFEQDAPAHTHSFTYSASGATITATCSIANCTLTDSKATLTIAAPTMTTYGQTGDGISANATLTGLSDFNTATGKTIAATDIKYVGRDGTSYAESATAPTNAGKYTAKITVEGQTASVNYEIAKASTSITANPAASEITYGQTLADSTLTGGTASVAGTFAWEDSTVAPAVSDSQNTEYTVVFTPEDANNATAECKVKLTVNTAENPITYPEKQAVTKTFSTASQTATLEAAKDGVGELSYGITSQKRGEETVNYFTLDGTTLTLAKNTPVGTYTVVVWTRAEGNGNVYGRIKESEVTVTIDKATPTVTALTPRTLTYTGSAQELVNAGSTNDGTLYYTVTTENTSPADESLYTTSIPTATDAGTYYVWYKAVGDENHSDSEPKAVTVVIAAPNTYIVTVTNDGNGTGTAAPASGVEGTEVTLTNTPAQGYKFKEWQVVSGGVTVADNKFTIGTANVEVKAIFEALPAGVYTVTVTNDGHGTGAATPASGVTGTEVTLTNTPAEGYQFKEWQVISGGVTVANNTFKIGTANVEVKAVFEVKSAGSETGKTETKSGAPVITASNMDEVMKSVAEAIRSGKLAGISEEVKKALSQPGAIATLTLVSSPLSDSEVPAQDKAALDAEAQANGYDGYQAFDLTLKLTVTDPATNQTVTASIHLSSTDVTFTLQIPEGLKKTSRTFYLLGCHDGKVSNLASTTAGTITGKSKQFSTYAIAYKDAEEPPMPVSSTFYFKKVWEGSAEKSIDFTLYSADGNVIHQGFEKHVLSAREWSYSAVFTDAGSCYVIEKPVPGYITRYVNVGEYAGITDRCCNGGTIINKKIPKTGDETPLLLWVGMLLVGAAGLTVALTIRKRKKAHK